VTKKLENLTSGGHSKDALGSKKSTLRTAVSLLGVSLGISAGVVAVGSGAALAEEKKARMRDMPITKKIDKSSPNLMKSTATGSHIKKAVLTTRKASGGQQDLQSNQMKVQSNQMKLQSDQMKLQSGGPSSSKYDLKANPKTK